MTKKIFYSAEFIAKILAVSQWESETDRTNALPLLPCQLSFSAIGVSVDVPIWVPKPNIDLRICLYERLYQDSIEVRSRWALGVPVTPWHCRWAVLGVPVTLALQGHILKALWALGNSGIMLTQTPNGSPSSEVSTHLPTPARVPVLFLFFGRAVKPLGNSKPTVSSCGICTPNI